MMLGLFKKKCPVNAREKAWIERRMAWLSRQLGIERLLNAEVAIPLTAEFPKFDYSEESARSVFLNVCQRMEIDPGEIDLQFHPHEELPTALGMYDQESDQTTVRIAESELLDLESFIAVSAHELCHHILLSGGLISTDEPDHEEVTDLLSVYLGFGVFAANAVLREATGDYLWRLRRSGYLSSYSHGYALSLFAFVRNEMRPSWRSFLRADAASSFHAGLRYLRRTGDSAFGVSSASAPDSPSVSEVVKDLRSQFDGRRVEALWQVFERKLKGDDIHEAVRDATRSNNYIVRYEAATAIAAMGLDVSTIVGDLSHLLTDPHVEVRAAAVRAFGLAPAHDIAVLPSVIPRLEDGDRRVVCQAIAFISDMGPTAVSAVEPLLRALRTALIAGDDVVGDATAAAVVRVVDSPIAVVEDFFDGDVELKREALGVLERLNETGAPDDHLDEPIDDTFDDPNQKLFED